MLVSRDPFARQELHRVSAHDYHGAGCQWCGSKGKPSKRGGYFLYKYEVRSDGGRVFPQAGVFCCKSCHDSYHS